ncbi:hypothetical protein JG687_00001810, partial [Phytophthora cactorum]
SHPTPGPRPQSTSNGTKPRRTFRRSLRSTKSRLIRFSGSAHRRRSLSVTERYWSARHAELGELYKVDKPSGDDDATESVDGCEEGPDRWIPAKFNNFWVKLVCTHSWSQKRRGKGIRKCYFEKTTGCKASIKAAVTWNDTENFNKFM